ncbi:SRPBCC family protein [Amycolatopsis benzoatilytica]|uniref:SRPBCC family protein n=1 Tax=Amycolatopsis benzoatilytica TaxID=346045 RepID=UPI00039A9983|nr:SRPBCC family protein [Amycolatopsis benzoatilytica]
MKRTIHVEAPVQTVFDRLKDPRYVPDGTTMHFEVTDVKETDQGVGTSYNWVSKTPVVQWEGFDVYTEFVPNQRITDRSSSSMAGDITMSFEAEGSGTKLTMESHSRSLWRFPPLRQLADLAKGMTADKFLAAVKAEVEPSAPAETSKKR